MDDYNSEPQRYELRSGYEKEAPLCPYGNKYEWIGFDLKLNEYIRFNKTVFKLLVNRIIK